MKTNTKKNKKTGILKNLSYRELTGKNTPSMIQDFKAIQELREQQEKRNNIVLNLIKFHKDETDNGNTDDLNNIKVAQIHLISNSLNNDLILEKDKQDLRDFISKLMQKRIELDNKKQKTTKGQKKKRKEKEKQDVVVNKLRI